MRFAVIPSIALALMLPTAVVAKDRDPIKVDGPRNIQGVQSVVVGSFAVAFVLEKNDEAFAGSRTNRAGIITRAKLANVDPAVFQAITDAAYADFQTRMTAAGFALADRGAMLADKRFANASFAAPGAVGNLRFGKDSTAKAAYYTPSAFGAQGMLSSDVGNGEIGGGGGGLMALGGMMRSMRGAGAANTRIMYAAMNHQPIVNVVYVVDFAGAERYGGRYAVQASVNVRANLAVVEGLSTLSLTNAKGQAGTLTVVEPIAVGGDFGTLADTTSGGTRAGNILGQGIAAAFGNGNSNHYNNVTFTAVSEQYREGAVQATVAANTRLVDRLATLR